MTLNFVLSLIIGLPIIGLIIIALLPKQQEKPIKYTALIFTLAAFALSIVVFCLFDRAAATLGRVQFEEIYPWIPGIMPSTTSVLTD
jgi:NADH-quinone oxidoreductase subunit M